MTHRELIQNLQKLGLNEAIVDTNAEKNGAPAIVLLWNGKEHYYNGSDLEVPEYHDQYQKWLISNFG